ncbi:hypothetical protein C162_21903 [Paenibacillus sp. FSL R7-269]|nr:hypothetical protein C162_21903 [Paenibacillus sp. FSL R7-269]
MLIIRVALHGAAFYIGGKAMNQARRFIEPPEPKQPVKCKGCVWGKWEASAQFCAKPICVKQDGGGGGHG